MTLKAEMTITLPRAASGKEVIEAVTAAVQGPLNRFGSLVKKPVPRHDDTFIVGQESMYSERDIRVRPCDKGYFSEGETVTKVVVESHTWSEFAEHYMSASYQEDFDGAVSDMSDAILSHLSAS